MDRVCEKGPILVNGKNLKKTSTTFGGEILYSLLIGDFPAPLRLLSPHIFKLRFTNSSLLPLPREFAQEEQETPIFSH